MKNVSKLSILLLLTLTGCAIFQSKEDWTIDKAESIKMKLEKLNKETTYVEVILKFGIPDYKHENPNYIGYTYEKICYETVIGCSLDPKAPCICLMPMLYFDKDKTLTLIIDFDDSWKFYSYELLW